MRVLLVSQRFPPARMAGSELQVQLLAKSLTNKGMDVRVLTTVEYGKTPPTSSRYPIETITVMRSVLRKPSQWLLTRRYLGQHGQSFDIVHCHCISPTCLAAIQHFKKSGTPVLLQPSLGGTGGEFEQAKALGIRRPINRIIARANAYAVLDDDIERDLKQLGIRDEQLISVRNGIDLDRFSPLSVTEKAKLRHQLKLPTAPSVLFVGQLIERKGVPELLKIWPKIQQEVPNANLIFVGCGPLATSVLQASKNNSSIVYLGERSDIHQLMQAVDIFTLPSHNESFGCATLEALASGLPVVAGQTGISTALPIDKRAGLIIDPCNLDQLEQALTNLLADSLKRKNYSEAGPKLAASYDINTVSEDLINIYRSLTP